MLKNSKKPSNPLGLVIRWFKPINKSYRLFNGSMWRTCNPVRPLFARLLQMNYELNNKEWETLFVSE